MGKQPLSTDLFRRYADEIFRYCFLRIGNIHLAGHLTLESFLLALDESPSADEREMLDAVRATARRLMAHHYRRVFQNQDWTDPSDPRKVHVHLSPCWAEQTAVGTPQIQPAASRAHRIHELARQSDRLSEEERLCFLRKFFLNKSFNEIALETDIPPDQVKLHIQTAIKTIREELDLWEGGP
jgi:DNA-directed RNA polymerase specialized sigma24 family protein